MSREELKKAIFRMDRPVKPGFKAGPPQFVSTQLPPEEQGDALCFDIQGKWTKDEKRCAAKRVTTGKGVRFFAKWCLEGPDKGHLLNPYSIYFKEGDDTRMEVRRGTLRYEFKLVNEAAFNSYLHFLQTKQYSYCQAAEREILNA